VNLACFFEGLIFLKGAGGTAGRGTHGGVRAEYYQQTSMSPVHVDSTVDCYEPCKNDRYVFYLFLFLFLCLHKANYFWENSVTNSSSGTQLVCDRCGICGGNNTCFGCDHVPFSNATKDICGVCQGNGKSCLSGCDKMPFSNATKDVCGVCNGDGKSDCSLLADAYAILFPLKGQVA